MVIDVLFNQISLTLSELQYRDLLHMSSYFAYYLRGVKVSIYVDTDWFMNKHNTNLFVVPQI